MVLAGKAESTVLRLTLNKNFKTTTISAILVKADPKKSKEIYKEAKKYGALVFKIKENQFEDFVLGTIMDKVSTGGTVNKEEILVKLKK